MAKAHTKATRGYLEVKDIIYVLYHFLMRNVIQSFKKVLNHAPTSLAAGQNTYTLVDGEDSVAAGQTSATDSGVPTGSVIKFIEIQFSAVNLVSVAAYMHVSIQHLRSGQSPIAANAVGGNPQRNQVHFQKMYTLAPDQNQNFVFRFKIPKKYQRVRDGDVWQFVNYCDQTHTAAMQVIYKFYR